MELIDVKEPLVITNHGKNRRCDFCNCEEGKLRLVGQFIVQLRRVDVFGEKKLACQTCFRKNEDVLISKHFKERKLTQEPTKQHFNMSFLFKQFISRVGYFFVFILLLSTVAVAQPKFPDQPDQTPIDGGLGLLAAAGGAYALKKLKDRNRDSQLSD